MYESIKKTGDPHLLLLWTGHGAVSGEERGLVLGQPWTQFVMIMFLRLEANKINH